MFKSMLAALGLFALAFLPGQVHATQVNVILDGLTFADGATAAGGWTYDLVSQAVTNVLVTVSNSQLPALNRAYDTSTLFSASPTTLTLVDGLASPIPIVRFTWNGPFLGPGETRLLCTEARVGDCATRAPSLIGELTFGTEFFLLTGTVRSVAIATVPEPAIYAMLGVGLGLLGLAARRRGHQTA